jgi:hypothetical protein
MNWKYLINLVCILMIIIAFPIIFEGFKIRRAMVNDLEKIGNVVLIDKDVERNMKKADRFIMFGVAIISLFGIIILLIN